MAPHSPNSSIETPPTNPFLTAYEAWVAKTPLVTRYVLSLQVVSYLCSWIANPSFALSTIPEFVIFHFEFYRLVLSPLVNTKIISLIFAFVSFSEAGQRLEQSMGSAAFGFLFICMGVLTNTAFLSICCTLALFSGDSGNVFMYASSSGLWTVLFGMISLECVKAPRNTSRPLLFAKVPVLYYPVALYIFFALISGSFSFPYLISLGVGYAYAFGYLERLKLTPAKAKQWEETILSNFHRREGWIGGTSIVGSDAWVEDPSSSSGAGSVLPMFQTGGTNNHAESRRVDHSPGAPRPGSVFRTGAAADSSGASSLDKSSFPESSGRALGSGTTASRRTVAETRAARLQAALERQAERNNNAEE